TTYNDLSSWRGTGQEKNGGTNTGISANPLLVAANAPNTIGDATMLHTLTNYQLLAASPAINAGLNLLTVFGIDPGPSDFYSTSLPSGASTDVGAFEWSQPSYAGTASNDQYTLRKNAASATE